MKKALMIISVLFIIIIATFFVVMLNTQNIEKNAQQINRQYEQYIGKTILGADIATLINKAMDSNEKNNIEKNEKGYYIDNGTNSVKIFIRLVKDGDYYSMEKIFNHQITEFVKNFNLQDFKCSRIEYHKKTKLVSEIYFDIIEE